MNPDALLKLGATLAKAGAPMLGAAIGGPAGSAIASTVIGALADALGVDGTADAIAAKIDADPAASTAVQRVEAAQGGALSELATRLADVQDARRQTVELARQGSAIAWGPVVVSILIVVLFGAAIMIMLLRPIPMTETQGTIFNIVFGGLVAAFTQVVNYWLGSSAGSARSGDAIRAIAQTVAADGKAARK